MGAEPTLTEIVRLAIESKLLDVHVSLPCRVESYDPATITVEALPMVRRAIEDADGKIQHEELPPIPNVPVLFPSSSAFSGAWPLVPGDFVLVVFCSSAIGSWRESGDIADPVDLRRHDLSHAVAIPCVWPAAQAPTKIATNPTAMLLEVNAPVTHVQVGAAATDYVANAELVFAELGKIATGIGGAGGTYTPPTAAVDIAALKLKSE